MPSRVSKLRFSPSKAGYCSLEVVDHAQALQVVLEALAGRVVLAQRLVQRILSGVAERRVAEIVRERDRLDQVLVQPEPARDRAADLRHLERMRQPGAEQVALVVQEHLGLVDQAPEGGAVDDAVPVALEGVARLAARLGDAPATARRRIARPRRQRPTVRHGVGDQAQCASITSATSASSTRMQSGPARRLDQHEPQIAALGLLVDPHQLEVARRAEGGRAHRQAGACDQGR